MHMWKILYAFIAALHHFISLSDAATVSPLYNHSETFVGDVSDLCSSYANTDCVGCSQDLCSTKHTLLAKQKQPLPYCQYCPSGLGKGSGCFSSENVGNEPKCEGKTAISFRSDPYQCPLISPKPHRGDFSCSAISDVNGYFIDFTSRKGSYIKHQKSFEVPIPNTPGVFYDVSVGICQGATNLSSNCSQGTDAPLRVLIKTLYSILGESYKGPRGLCYEMGNVSSETPLHFKVENESEGYFELAMNYGFFSCCPSENDRPGVTREVPLILKIVPNKSKCELDEYFSFQNVSFPEAMWNCSLWTAVYINFETNLLCPEKLYRALNANKTSFKCSKIQGVFSCEVQPVPLKGKDFSTDRKCNPEQFQVGTFSKSKKSFVVLREVVVKSNCRFTVSNKTNISVRYKLNGTWEPVQEEKPSSVSLSTLAVALIAGICSAVLALVAVIVIVIVIKRKLGKSEVSSIEKEQRRSTNGEEKKANLVKKHHVLCLCMPFHEHLMKKTVIDLLKKSDKLVQIFDLKALRESRTSRLTKGVKVCPLVFIGIGATEKNKKSEKALKKFKSEAEYVHLQKVEISDHRVIPVLLSGRMNNAMEHFEFLKPLNAVDFTISDQEAIEDEISRVKNALCDAFGNSSQD